MQMNRSKNLFVAALLGACAWVVPGLTAGQDGRPQLPDAPVAKPSPRPADDCRNALAGLVFRRVGNFVHGPSRPAGLKNIQVQLLDAQDRRVAQTRTDRDGRYAFRDVCPGTYTVCPGTPCPTRGPIPSRYSPAEQRVTVPPLLQKGIDFELTEPPPARQPPGE